MIIILIFLLPLQNAYTLVRTLLFLVRRPTHLPTKLVAAGGWPTYFVGRPSPLAKQPQKSPIFGVLWGAYPRSRWLGGWPTYFVGRPSPYSGWRRSKGGKGDKLVCRLCRRLFPIYTQRSCTILKYFQTKITISMFKEWWINQTFTFFQFSF